MSKSEFVKWIIILLFACAILFMFGCNPVKQVLKSPEKTEQVVRQYVKTNPPKNDTLIIPGDTVVTSRIEFDSIPLPYPVNHKYTEYHYKETLVRDTVKVIDRSLLDAMNNRLTNLEYQFNDMKESRNKWRVIAISLIALIVSAVGFLVVRTFQPKITIGK